MISVIIPTFNRAQMLMRAVESVLKQTWRDFELIVIDDGSEEDLKPVRQKVHDAGQKFITIDHAGVAKARNAGLQQARGEWVALLDSDDYWLPNKLKRQVTYHQQNRQFALSQTLEMWYRHGKRVNRRNVHEQPVGDAFFPSLRLCCISSSSVLVRREVLQEVGNYDERLRVCEDYDLWLRVTARHRVGLVPEELVIKEGGHSDQLSHSEPALDRFRLFALFKLLIERPLSEKQRKMVITEIDRKALILEKGARKRALAEADLYVLLRLEADKLLKEDKSQNSEVLLNELCQLLC
jgi:glycosyltransferase involved in cell wall biosynthesis